jgi:sulfur carrier protein ThiS
MKTMLVTIILHSIYREKLPAEAHGRIEMTFPEGTTVEAIFRQLKIPSTAVFSVNNQLERSIQRALQDGDEVRFFRQSTGG